MPDRTALFICCSEAEAETIRRQAQVERRTISAYILNILLSVLPFEEKIAMVPAYHRPRPRPLRPRTGLLLRCPADEANRIRAAATRIGQPISVYVLERLRRWWKSAGVPLAS